MIPITVIQSPDKGFPLAEIRETMRAALVKSSVVVLRNYFPRETEILERGIWAGVYSDLIKEVGRLWTTEDELRRETEYQYPGETAIIVLSHDGLLGAKKLPLHSDLSHHPARPYPFRALLAVELPGDDSAQTSFYSMFDLHESCSNLENYVGWHAPAYPTGWAGRWNRLVQTDPFSGRNWIAYDQTFVKKIAKYEFGEMIPLLDWEEAHLRETLNERIAELTPYVHHWELGDLLIWNNRGVLHSRTASTPGERRKMYRITFDLIV